MHVIIEGTDKTGKTTLAYELAKRLYFPIVKRLKPKKNIFIECIDFFTDTKESMIVDRFHLSEEAYGPVKRVKSRFDFRELKLIEMSCLSLGTFNIYCSDDKENIKKRMIELEENFISIEELDPILDGFNTALKNSILDWHEYKIGDSIDELAEKIKKKFEKRKIEKRYEIFSKYRTTGNYSGSVLIFGEKYGPNWLPPRIPFGNNRPGLLFFKSLEQSKLDWKDIMISNAIKNNEEEVDNEKALIDEVSFKKVEKIICLGNNSYEIVLKILDKNKIKKKVFKVLHPAYWFVYGSGDIKSYANLFNKIYEN